MNGRPRNVQHQQIRGKHRILFLHHTTHSKKNSQFCFSDEYQQLARKTSNISQPCLVFILSHLMVAIFEVSVWFRHYDIVLCVLIDGIQYQWITSELEDVARLLLRFMGNGAGWAVECSWKKNVLVICDFHSTPRSRRCHPQAGYKLPLLEVSLVPVLRVSEQNFLYMWENYTVCLFLLGITVGGSSGTTTPW